LKLGADCYWQCLVAWRPSTRTFGPPVFPKVPEGRPPFPNRRYLFLNPIFVIFLTVLECCILVIFDAFRLLPLSHFLCHALGVPGNATSDTFSFPCPPKVFPLLTGRALCRSIAFLLFVVLALPTGRDPGSPSSPLW